MKHKTTLPQAITLSDAQCAAMLGVCKTHWRSMVASGKAPAPLRLGRRILWRKHDVEAWLNAGAPNRDKWERMRKV